MKCIEFEEMISLYIDNVLDEKESSKVRAHMDMCSECRELYEALIENMNMCKELPLVDLPEDFHSSLHEKLVKAKEEIEIQEESELKKDNKVISLRDRFKKNWRRYGSLAAALICLLGYGAISNLNGGKKDEKSADMIELANYEAKMAPQPKMEIRRDSLKQSDTLEFSAVANKENKKSLEMQKIIKNSYISLSVEDLDMAYDKLDNKINSYLGYMENSNIYNNDGSRKSGNFTIRMPQDKNNQMIEFIKSLGKVKSIETGSENVTGQYYDTENRVKNLEYQEKQLREIMKKAVKVEDIIQIERELTRVRTQIDSLTGSLKHIDDLVSYTTINLNMQETTIKGNKIDTLDKSIWQKAKEGFIYSINRIVNNLEYLLIKVISNIPNLILVVTVLGGVYLIYKRFKK